MGGISNISSTAIALETSIAGKSFVHRRAYNNLPSLVKQCMPWNTTSKLSVEAVEAINKSYDEIGDHSALLALIKSCVSLREASEIHAFILEKGLLRPNFYVGTALIRMYARCGSLSKSKEVFDELVMRDVVAWNALVAGFVEHGLDVEALECFEGMKEEGISPNAVTFSCLLKACSRIGAIEKGEWIFHQVKGRGLFGKNIVLGNAVVDMYVKCAALRKAQTVFDELPIRDVVSWTTLIVGYVANGLNEDALKYWGLMQDAGFSPDSVTYTYLLKACGNLRQVEKGKEVHTELIRWGVLEKDVFLGAALVDMYAKCGALTEAQEVFDELPTWDVVVWNALIGGYTDYGFGDKALECYSQMQDKGLFPNLVTCICLLKACGIIGAMEKGEAIHLEVYRQGLLEKDVLTCNALINMYAKCGKLAEAWKMLDEFPIWDVVTWNLLTDGYAQLGQIERVILSVNKMIEEHIEPDTVTFIVLLSACSHVGLLQDGQGYFNSMSSVYAVIPTSKHHACMVDLFGRAGHFGKAREMVETVPPSCVEIWITLLGTCQKWMAVEVGKWAFKHVSQCDGQFASASVCMGNIYADAAMQCN